MKYVEYTAVTPTETMIVPEETVAEFKFPLSKIYDIKPKVETKELYSYENVNPKVNLLSYLDSSTRASTTYTGSSYKNGYIPQNGDVVEIKNTKHKWGHTAQFVVNSEHPNGIWVSDFKLKNMDPYSDGKSTYRIFRNPNKLEAEAGAKSVYDYAKSKSLHQCAKYVRQGFERVAGSKYAGEGYNGNNFGDYLTKKGWTLVARKGIKFAEEGTTLNSPKYVSYETTLPTVYDLSSQKKVLPSITELTTPAYLKGPYQAILPAQVSNNTMFDNLANILYDLIRHLNQSQKPSWNPVISKKLLYSVLLPKQPIKNLSILLKDGLDSKKLPTELLRKHFALTMYTAYRDSLLKAGLDPKYAVYLTAQSALESTWGTRESGKNNLGGIKGKGTVRTTHEANSKGKLYKTEQEFKDYDTVLDYIDDKIRLLNNKYNAFSGNYVDSIIKGGYATDPNYRNKLNGTILSVQKRLQ